MNDSLAANITLIAGDKDLGQVFFRVENPVTKACIEATNYLIDVEKFCKLHNLQIDREALSNLLDQLSYTPEGGWRVPEGHENPYFPVSTPSDYLKQIQEDVF